jgi:hypothetical protein
MSALPKIEVFRIAAHASPLFSERGAHRGELMAVVTDVADLEATAPVIQLDAPGWLDDLTSRVEREIMGIAT